MVESNAAAESHSLDLSKLPRLDKDAQLASFIKEQRRNAKVYVAEGRRHVELWDKEGVPERGTPREDRIGLETPILKARNPRCVVEPPKPPKPVSRRTQSPGGRATKAASEATTSKKGNRVAEKENVGVAVAEAPKAAKKKGRARPSRQTPSDPEEDTEALEHRKRLEHRRERRRERREIVNPKKRKNLSESEGDSEDGTQKKQGAKGKRPKVPAGLALMHGFSATNVGKSRLTLEPNMRSTGVFSRGRASTKTSTARKPAQGFSEELFLNKRKSGPGRDEAPESEIRKGDGRDKRKKALAQPPRRKVASKDESKASSECSGDSNTRRSSEGGRGGTLSPRPPSSVVWDIERDGADLPSSDVSVPSIPRASVAPTGKESADRASHSSDLVSNGGTLLLGPQDSASQCVSNPPKEKDVQPAVDVFSKYFQQILESGEVEGRRKTPPLVHCSQPAREWDGSREVSPGPSALMSVDYPWDEGTNDQDVVNEGFQDVESLDWRELEAFLDRDGMDSVICADGFGEEDWENRVEPQYTQLEAFSNSDDYGTSNEIEEPLRAWWEDMGGVPYGCINDTDHGGFPLNEESACDLAGDIAVSVEEYMEVEGEWHPSELEDVDEVVQYSSETQHGVEESCDDLCRFLGGRSALLGLNLAEYHTAREPMVHGGLSTAETDVAKTLKNHWRPQKL